MINMVYDNTPVRTIRAEAELFSRSSATASTISYNGDLKEISVERLGESKVFGFGIVHKGNLKVRDIEKLYDITTDNYFNISFNDVRVFPSLYVSEVRRNEKTNELSITVYDALDKANNHYVSELELAGYNLFEFVQACSELLGVSGYDASGLEEFELYFENGANFEGSETLREALNDVAEATQTVYYLDASNNLIFKRLDKDGDAALTISKEDYFELNTKTNRRLVGVCSATELGDNVEAKLDLSGTVVYIRDNAFWELREDVATLVENALANVQNLTINQFDCSWRGNYLLEPGDKIALEAKDGSLYYSYLFNDSIKYDGSFSQKTEWQYEEDEDDASNPSSLGEVLKQTYAKVDKANKQVDIVVSEIDSVESQLSALQLNTDSITASVSQVESRVDDITGSMEELTTKVEASMTNEQIKIEIQNGIANGVEKIETKTGFVFNEEGLNISSSESEISTTITENGMRVNQGSKEVLTANDEGVKAVDLHATTYLIIGDNSRFEDYGSNRTGCFWIGG